MRKSVAVTRFCGEAERELSEQGDEIGVIFRKCAYDILKTGHRTQRKSRFGIELLLNVVHIIPGVNELPPTQRPIEVEHSSGPEGDDGCAVEEVQLHTGSVQHPQRAVEQHTAAPQAHQREERRCSGEQQAHQHQQECSGTQPDAAFCPGRKGPLFRKYR